MFADRPVRTGVGRQQCPLRSLAIPAVVYRGMLRDLRAVNFPPKVKDRLTALSLRTGIVVCVVALALSLTTCAFIVWRRAKRSRRLGPAVVANVALILAFFIAPWLTIALASGGLPDGVISLWVGPGVLLRALPDLCAVVAGLAFAGMTRFGGTLTEAAA